MSEIYDVAIIGAGACGLACALNLKTDNVIILDAKSGALKLALTGNNRCNITNTFTIDEFIQSYGKNGRFVIDTFRRFFRNELLEFLKYYGIETITENEKIRLKNRSSKELAHILLNETQKKFKLKKFHKVIKVKQEDETFGIETLNNKTYKSKFVLLATGGKSYPQTGSDGSGYKLAEQLGHRIESLEPIETPFCCKKTKNLQGISLRNVELTLKIGKKTIKTEGDIIFTHFGISGPAVLKLSSESFKKGKLFLRLINLDEKTFINRLHFFKGKTKNLLSKHIPERLAQLAPYAELNCANLNRKQLNKIADFVFRFELNIEKCGFKKAFATKGGVSLKEVNPKTLESKIAKNLFFCGEILNIQGPIGGFNLQFAFSSGFLVADEINRRLFK
ncbi:NAD(P)/FAD-dependent oxidoreductase [Hippea alviniae]|uniref:NAD(P)/FAD-dependent oxidoreductase n=1 Tax=Hippea alviniae TaxID=1279027 RepID=UPI0003B676DC|nr:aminoacetone oxidase family FAD-binding enzyme [Hippea alviniae]